MLIRLSLAGTIILWASVAHATITADPGIALKGDSVTFSTTLSIPEEEIQEGWKYQWKIDGSAQSETESSLTRTMDQGGVVSIDVALVDSADNVQQTDTTLSYSVIDMDIPDTPSEVFFDANEVHTASCSTQNAVPPGGSYKWFKASGPGTVTFSPNDSTSASTTTATFSTEGTYTISVTYTLNPELTKTSTDMEVKKGTFSDDPVYVVKGKTKDVTFSLPSGVNWGDVTFDTSDANKATVTRPPTGNDITVNGIATAEYNIRLRAKKGGDYVGFGLVVVAEVTDVAVLEADLTTHGVQSVQHPGGKEHFVTPKGVGVVMLQASVSPDTEGVKELISWTATADDGGVTASCPAVGNDRTTVKFPRDKADRILLKCFICSQEAWRGWAWVVSAEVDPTGSVPIQTEIDAAFTTISGGFYFDYHISPKKLFTEDDRPNLEETNDSDPPNVPVDDTGVRNKGESLALGANRKWDGSRAMKLEIVNPANITFPYPPHKPSFFTTYPNYPSTSVCGNDDAITSDGWNGSLYEGEDNNPYDDPKGVLKGLDRVRYQCQQVIGVDQELAIGTQFEARCHFREFVRLELGTKWYRISPNYLWQIYIVYEWASEAAEDVDHNNDGDKEDFYWKDGGTTKLPKDEDI